MDEKKFIIYQEGEEFEVSEKWLENVEKLEDIDYLRVFETNKINLEVGYKNGNVLIYGNYHGSWGFPTKMA